MASAGWWTNLCVWICCSTWWAETCSDGAGTEGDRNFFRQVFHLPLLFLWFTDVISLQTRTPPPSWSNAQCGACRTIQVLIRLTSAVVIVQCSSYWPVLRFEEITHDLFYCQISSQIMFPWMISVLVPVWRWSLSLTHFLSSSDVVPRHLSFLPTMQSTTKLDGRMNLVPFAIGLLSCAQSAGSQSCSFPSSTS